MKRKLLAFLLLFSIIAMSSPVFAQDLVYKSEVIRHSGKNRYETALEVSRASFEKSDFAIVVSGESFPDALAGGPLAGILDAPILLTPKSDMPDGLLEELVKLQVKKVYILGGTEAIDRGIEQQLRAVASVERLGGEDRYETCVLIATRIRAITGETQVAIANGRNFPDAISASGYLGAAGIPLLLTEKNALPEAVLGYLTRVDAPKTLVLGGTEVISAGVESQLKGVERIAGANRWETSVAIANYGFDRMNTGETLKTVLLVNGMNFPDALSSAPISSMLKAPILLTSPDQLHRSVKGYVEKNQPYRVIVVGGLEVVTSNVIGEVLSVLSNPGDEQPEPLEKNKYYDNLAQEAFLLINQIRANKGIYPYVWDGGLEASAKVRAVELTTKFSHTRPDGQPWHTINANAKGENIVSNATTANILIELLTKTSGGSSNIIRDRSDFKAIGIGCYTNDKGEPFWSLLYGLPTQ